MRLSGLMGLLVSVWLIVGVAASVQRHYFDFNNTPTDCVRLGTIGVTILAGPLNYGGMNPKVHDCHVNVPQPSP